MVGTPVTFTTRSDGGVEPLTYKFSVDGAVNQARSQSPDFNYTFDKEGDHTISVRMFNAFAEFEDYTEELTVVKPYTSQTPLNSSLYFNSLETFCVNHLILNC